MKELRDTINEAMKRNRRPVGVYNYTPKDKDELKELIKERISEEGPNCDLNDIDVSKITKMSFLFWESDFNGDISEWDVSKVVDMSFMFYNCPFDGDISEWDVSSVRDMDNMFSDCPLDKNPPKWYKK